MPRLRLVAATLAVIILAPPSTAVADNAGDNQYQDPFSSVPSQPKEKQKRSGTQDTTPQPTVPAPAPTAPAPAASAAPVQTAPAEPAADPGTLPRTGFPLAPVVAAGVALIAAGLALRRLRRS